MWLRQRIYFVHSICSDENDCCNPYHKTEEAEDEEDIEMENVEENDLVDETMKM